MDPKFLQTGDSDAKHHLLLEYVMKNLVRLHGFKVLRRCEDRVGTFAFLMKDRYDQRFYLIAKGSKLWQGDIVSCQGLLPTQAKNEKRPIMLAWLPPQEKLVYYLFDPASVIAKNMGFNDRKGVNMINFSISLGARYDPAQSVLSVWQQSFNDNDA